MPNMERKVLEKILTQLGLDPEFVKTAPDGKYSDMVAAMKDLDATKQIADQVVVIANALDEEGFINIATVLRTYDQSVLAAVVLIAAQMAGVGTYHPALDS